MKKYLLFVFLVCATSIYAQSDITDKYDSLKNVLPKEYAKRYIGQKFYVPTNSECEKGFGYRNFKKDITGKIYMPISGSRIYTKCEAITGKYFDVIDVVYDTRAYIGDVYLKLQDNITGRILFYDYKEYEFPFIVCGHYDKMKQLYIGKTFLLDFGNKEVECVDFIIDETHVFIEELLFNDSTRYFVERAIIEDKINRKVQADLEKEELISKKLKLGLDTYECRILLGDPIKINITKGSFGRHEQWVYENRYLYFENGILTVIQESE